MIAHLAQTGRPPLMPLETPAESDSFAAGGSPEATIGCLTAPLMLHSAVWSDCEAAGVRLLFSQGWESYLWQKRLHSVF
jgi:hypothetical protein